MDHLGLFFSPDRPFALGLNALIAALTLVAVAMCVRVTARLLPQEREAVAEARRATPPSRAAVRNATSGTGSILERRVKDLTALSASNSPVDGESLSALSQLAFQRQLQIPQGIGRSLIVLGLLGTLWGLGSAVTSLAATLRPSGGGGDRTLLPVDELVGAILETLGGMQTAFGTTLAGIGGALVVGLAVGIARRRQTETYEELERTVATLLIPLFNTSEADRLSAAASALEGMQRRVAEDMQGILTALDEQGRALGARLTAEFERIEETFRNRAEELIRATGSALESTLSIIGERAEGEPTLAEYVRTVRSTVQDLERATEAAGRMIPALEQTLVALLESHRSQLGQIFEEHRHAMAPMAEKQVTAAELLTSAARENVGHVRGLAEVLGRFTSTLEDARETWRRTDELVEGVGRACQTAIETGLASVIEQVQAANQTSSSDREAVIRQLNQFANQLEENLRLMREERQASVRRMDQVVAAVAEASSGAVREVGAQLAHRGDATGQAVKEAVERLSREIRDVVVPGAAKGQAGSGQLAGWGRGVGPVPGPPEGDGRAGPGQ